MKPIVWTIAGSDSSGGAGIQADLKTFNALGVHGCSVITAITSQNQSCINAIQFTESDSVMSQIHSLETTSFPSVIKIGMLGKSETINQCAEFFKTYQGIIILDPLLISTSGYALFHGEINAYLNSLKKILPFIDLITPNIREAEHLVKMQINSHNDIETAAEKILALGVKSVLVKGGHFNDDIFCEDYWSNGKESFWISSKRSALKNCRGTGCTLACAISACLALEYDIKDAIVIAKMYINQGIRLSYMIKDHGYLNHHGWPENQVDLPSIIDCHRQNERFLMPAFPDMKQRIGLYPIVDNIEWLNILLPLGVKTIQLRIKKKNHPSLENDIKEAISIANRYSAQLFINDYWELAIKHKAYGVHLGQEDLSTADIEKIRQSGLRLGISTHCYFEVARAHSLQPSYLACGPIYPTTSKIMPFKPQGVHHLQRWRRTLDYSLVAIGGIDLERLPDILSTQTEGVAMISAITQAQNPVAMTQKLLLTIKEYLP